MTKIWDGPTPYPVEINHWSQMRLDAFADGYRAAKNDDMVMYEVATRVLWNHPMRTGSHLEACYEELKVALAAYEAGLRKENIA